MTPVLSQPRPVADLPTRAPTAIALVPDADQLSVLADRLGLVDLRKVRLAGVLRSEGPDWVIEARLGATMVQPCRVTAEPVTTRIDEPVLRRFAADMPLPAGDDDEMPEDDTVEPLGAVIDPGAVLEEALSLAVPPFPRAPDAEALDLTAAPPGAAPLTDEARRPFAGLAALRARMDGDGGGDDDA